MSHDFVRNFMYAARKITHAERLIAVDRDMKVIELVNVEPAQLETADFGTLATSCLQEALTTREPVITNNVITDPSEAPTTNTNFSNLRVIVALAVGDDGAVYMDQHIRNGVIPKPMVDRMTHLIHHLIQSGQKHIDAEEMLKTYQQLGVGG